MRYSQLMEAGAQPNERTRRGAEKEQRLNNRQINHGTGHQKKHQ